MAGPDPGVPVADRCAADDGPGPEHATGRTTIPLGNWSKAANIPGHAPTQPLSYPSGMPGARVGQ